MKFLLQINLYHYSTLVYRAVGSVRTISCKGFFDDSGQHTVFRNANKEKPTISKQPKKIKKPFKIERIHCIKTIYYYLYFSK